MIGISERQRNREAQEEYEGRHPAESECRLGRTKVHGKHYCSRTISCSRCRHFYDDDNGDEAEGFEADQEYADLKDNGLI